MSAFCDVCGKVATEVCGNCKGVSYCSRECCIADWAKHKASCMAVSDYAVDRYLRWEEDERFYYDYTFLYVLGSGTYGTVFLVQHKESGAYLAAKIISQGKLANDVTYLKMLSRPKCTKHVPCYEDHFLSRNPETDELTYVILFEYLDGPTLDRYKSEHPFANWTIRLPILLRALLEGLAYIHSYDVIHGDIKPQNLVFRNGADISSVVFVDFGLACSDDCDETNVGTPLYKAPELLTSNVPTQASDVFATAASIYSIFMKFQWVGWNRSGILQFNVETYERSRNALRFITKEMEQRYVDVLDRMIELNPAERITAEDALEALGRT
jgi:serine/threonine protein kinase